MIPPLKMARVSRAAGRAKMERLREKGKGVERKTAVAEEKGRRQGASNGGLYGRPGQAFLVLARREWCWC